MIARSDIDTMIELEVQRGKKFVTTGFVKRISTPSSLEELRETASQFGQRHGIEGQILSIQYTDGEKRYCVDTDRDFDLGL